MTSIRTCGALAALVVSAAVLLGMPLPAAALPEDADQPIQIQAERAEMDRNAGTVVYSGGVEARQGTMLVNADRMTVHSEDGKVVRITATGRPAKYQQQLEAEEGLVKADAETITYHTSEERVNLQGKAFLEQGGNEISGAFIDYDIVAGKVIAQAGDDDRVEVILQPAERSQ